MQSNHSNKATLAETVQAMKQWRAQKKHNNEKMPAKLRAQIINMLAKYPQSTVAHALRLSNSTIFALRQMQNNNSPTAAVSPPQPQQAGVNFIPFHLNTTASHPPDKPIANTATPPSARCKIIHPNGATLIINGNDLNAIIQAFLCSK